MSSQTKQPISPAQASYRLPILVLQTFIFLFFQTTLSFGQSWSPLGSGMSSFAGVYALTVYPPQTGELIAGGTFGSAGGVTTNYIARWNGIRWDSLGDGIRWGGPYSPGVWALTVYTGGLIAGGRFDRAGGLSANYIAKRNGSSWSPLGVGMNNYVSALTVYGGELIAGGRFLTAGGISASRIAKWNGSSWSPLGSGVGDNDATVDALCVYGGELIAGGSFSSIGGVTAMRIARWNGNSWASLGSGMDLYVRALTVYGNDLIAGGSFTTAGGVSANYIAKWNGSSWSPLGSGMDGTLGALAVYGTGLIAGGYFTVAGGVNANRVARWNGSSWMPLGSGITGGTTPSVSALCVYGTDLIAGGRFTTAGGVSANNIARWNDNSGIIIISGNVPNEFKLYQNYPNPFNASTKFKVEVSKLGQSELVVYDVRGKEVAILFNQKLNPGIYEVQWDVGDFPSGVYFYKLVSGDFSETKRMVLLK